MPVTQIFYFLAPPSTTFRRFPRRAGDTFPPVDWSRVRVTKLVAHLSLFLVCFTVQLIGVRVRVSRAAYQLHHTSPHSFVVSVLLLLFLFFLTTSMY